MVIIKRDIIIRDEDNELEFRWNRSHTINIYSGDTEVDVMSIGDFAKAATFEEFEEAVDTYLQTSDSEL